MTAGDILRHNVSQADFVSDDLLSNLDAEVPRLGIKTRGIEREFFAAMKLSLLSFYLPYVALEIGTGDGASTEGIWLFLGALESELPRFVVTCDLPNGWSFSEDKFDARMERRAVEHTGDKYTRALDVLYLYKKPSTDLLANPPFAHLNFVFVDGCHGYDCVTRDFQGINKLIVQGGVIVFHDTNPSCQGQDMQPHCKTGIDVRRAVTNILSVHESDYELLADIEANPGNNGIIVVRKK